ncbi:enoyl-CoA hydratase-related protein [Roseibium sp. MMSF_3412]|uniref:enoyl-CoA hydratase-related protein n=1 Tax=Roseibium sp. MMSF_3412 TaxID=3046712 RepID=UPI00273FC6E0|nr:enoyl-CoA hydratase-related protein [Roseibium sp. MMSF_3412]
MSSHASQPNPVLNIHGMVAELVLNAPERKNALSLAAWERIPDLLAELAEVQDVRVCVVRGEGGKSFCAGADISEFEAIRSTKENALHYDEINVAAFSALKSLAVPVIAAIEGPCLGGGLGLALACDLRIASTTAFFGIPAAKLGLAYPPEALSDLLETVSSSNAKRILFTGNRFAAQDALQMGLINETVDPPNLQERINALCDTIVSNAPLSIWAAKQAVNELSAKTAREPEIHRQNAQSCIESADYREGCRAFLEKRHPEFSGN